jgi:hypothetical protein
MNFIKLQMLIVLLVITFCSTTAIAQNVEGSTVNVEKKVTTTQDTILSKKTKWQPNPKKAGLYAALVPGLGQVYNRQYWKLPIVYGGLAVAGYLVVFNSNEYNTYRKAYIGRINNPYPTDEYVGVYNTDQLKQIQDDYNRSLNMSVLFASVGYLVQVLDAITAAHLRNFDISRDISMQMRPVVTPLGGGIGLVMNFK